MTLESDTPQATDGLGEADPFGRRAFAMHLARHLKIPTTQDSLVIGLEGEWGSGKSWVIEQIKAQLLNDGVITIHFNPWLIAAEEELIGSFLQEMAAQILEHSNELSLDKARSLAGTIAAYGKKLVYLKYLKYLPVVRGVGEFIEDHEEHIQEFGDNLEDCSKTPEMSIHARRTAVENAISNLNQTMVVIIDDLDRLRQREIQSMVQLVKAVANFKGVSFLLAYDAKYVAQAISHDGTIEAGSAYLEKIVQLACTLPPMVPWVYRDWLHAQCLQFLGQRNKQLNPFETERLLDVVKLVARLLRHPRDVVRWLNRLHFAWNNVADAIDFGDLLLVEALRIVAPDSLRSLIKQPNLLFAHADSHFTSRYPVVQDNAGDAWLKQVSSQAEILRAFIALFPHLKHPTIKFERDENALSHRRLQEYNHWLRYLNLSQVQGQPDAALALAMLRNPQEYHKLEQLFETTEEFGGFCNLIHDYLSSANVPKMREFVEHFCRAAKYIWQADIPQPIRDQAFECVRKLLLNMPHDERDATFPLIVEIAPLSLAGALANQFTSAYRQLWMDHFYKNQDWQENDDSVEVVRYLSVFAGELSARKQLHRLIESKHHPTLQRLEYYLKNPYPKQYLKLLPSLNVLRRLLEPCINENNGDLSSASNALLLFFRSDENITALNESHGLLANYVATGRRIRPSR